MPKIKKTNKPSLKYKIIESLTRALNAQRQGRPVLENLDLTNKDLENAIPSNLDHSYKQAYNAHMLQLHQVGSLIKKALNQDEDSGRIRRRLGLTRHRYYQALAIVDTILEPKIIPYLEEVSPNDFYELNRSEMEFVRNAVFWEVQTWKEIEERDEAQEKEMRKLVEFLFS